ncbi:MAG: beta-ketoacyl-ACP synthase III [Candidatus Margulisiibacteriota bacterium]
MRSVGILGVGHYVPERVVTNADIVAMGLDTSDEWIVERTGIRERRLCAPDQATSDLAFEAAKNALADARVSPEEIDLVIVATTTQDYLGFPSVACLLQHRLGLRQIGAFDLAAACTGFNYALSVGVQFVRTRFANKVLVVGADCLSKYVDWSDRSICVLFGDGAGAVVLGEVSEGLGVLTSDLHADGSKADLLMVKGCGSRDRVNHEVIKNEDNYMNMNGKAVFKVAIHCVVPCVLNALSKVNLKPDDLDFLVPHQANVRIIDQAREKLSLPWERVVVNLDRYGNTSAASIPIALSEAKQAGRFQSGQLLGLVGFGAGFTWGANLVRWGT